MSNLWTDEPMDDLHKQIDELILDPKFRAWVLHPTPETEAHWADYLSLGLHHREEAVRQARLMVLVLKMPEYPVSQDLIQDKVAQLGRRISMESAESKPTYSRSIQWGPWRWVAAAVFIFSIGLWIYQKDYSSRQLSQVSEKTDDSLIQISGTVVEESTADEARLVLLPDGSKVTLQPQSRLRYDKEFTQATRTVILTGQAFFEVTHNPEKPFLVFTNKVVTRVLGTSFTVSTRPGQPANVSVLTGRVAVYDRRDFDKTDQRALPGVTLTPNQQATFDEEAGVLTKTLVPVPLPLSNELTNPLSFENRPVLEVIEKLEEIYGVSVSCDRERLGRCRVTVLLENETLYDQLVLLCKLIDGHYETSDTTITLVADGCP